ncbi:MAG: glucan biosynthesis protein [Gemmatimonadota bacterium]
MAKRILVGVGAMLLVLLAVRAFVPGLLPDTFSGLIPEEQAFEPTPDSAALPGAPPDHLWEKLEGVGPGGLFPALTERARLRAERPWQPPPSTLPPGWARLGYDSYRQVAYRPDAALWRGESPFEIQFFHLGGHYNRPVRMVEVWEEGAAVIPYRAELFRYPSEDESSGVAEPPSQRELGELHDFAGFRVHFPLNRPGVADEVVVFQGASYFRLLGPGQVHGLSGRGLAVNTPLESGEEFPDFRQFWLVRPDSGQRALTFYALLDGPSVTGAYRFLLEPGGAGDPGVPAAHTTLEVEARLFARKDVQRLGVAPLTSMFLHSPATPHGFDDLRPRVHDSQGLLMATGEGEWIWRPLSNRFGVQVTSLRDRRPLGFGLIQRTRDFREYLDLEARYHLRPSVWVELLDGDWGAGGVELVEIPTTSEFFDNIVAYWVPDIPFTQGDERRFTYRLHTFHGPRWEPGSELPRGDGRVPASGMPEAWVERMAQGWASLPGEANPLPRSHRRFVVDFHVAPEAAPNADARPPEVSFQASSGEPSDLQVVPLPESRGWRATFRLAPDGATPVDMRLLLHRDGQPVSETWSYLWVPPREAGP